MSDDPQTATAIKSTEKTRHSDDYTGEKPDYEITHVSFHHEFCRKEMGVY